MRRLAMMCTATMLALDSALALACSVLPPPSGSHVMHPSGDVSRGAHVLVEDLPLGEYELEGADGALVAFTTTPVEGQNGDSRGIRLIPEEELRPGTYTLSLVWDDDTNIHRVYPYSETTTFTVLDTPPPPPPPAPEIEWDAVLYQDVEQPDPFAESTTCGPRTNTTVQKHRVVVTKTPGVLSHASIQLVGFGSDESMTNRSRSDEFEFELGALAPFVTCVSATVTDIYGRTSEPTELCVPTSCEARDRNASRHVSWSSQPDGCSDWSPGFAERNAPGCACAQSPAAPTPAPWLAALALLALAIRSTTSSKGTR